MRLLLMETATLHCSVAVASAEEILSEETKSSDHFVHAEEWHSMADQQLKNALVGYSELSAIVISKGPGSYTGLRIGVSAAKGYAFAHDLPLIGIGTLESLADFGFQSSDGAEYAVAMLDARKNENYVLVIASSGEVIIPTSSIEMDDSFALSLPQGKKVWIGGGLEKVQNFIAPNELRIDTLPKASMLHRLAVNAFKEQRFENLAYFEPHYLKDFIPGVSIKNKL